MAKLFIYGLCDVYYDSFYIKGLKEYYKVNNVYFSCKKFPSFRQGSFAIIVKHKNIETKFYIDSRDQSDFWDEELEWCDVYGKVNYNSATLPDKFREKIIPIGSSFGLKIWNLPRTLFLAAVNYMRFKNKIKNKKVFLANYLAQTKRDYLKSYHSRTNLMIPNYIFFASSIWKKEHSANQFRANFINACLKNDNLQFEGGFVSRSDGNNLKFDSITVPKNYSVPEYLMKINQSNIVFNTPAVDNCLGWKLAEFLAMGKIILSTSFYNQMGEELLDGKHIIFLKTGSEEEIIDKTNFILNSEVLQLKLSRNSKLYFDENLSPKKVIEKLHFKCNNLMK